MSTKWFGVLLMLAAIALPALAQTPSDATSNLTPDGRIPRQYRPRKVVPGMVPEYDAARHVTISYNTIWTGYAVTGTDFTYVHGSWTVAPVDCTKTPNTDSSEWVGIDGWSSDTVEQTGTDADCNGKAPSYYVWYEFYPLNTIVIRTVSITPGEKFSASVTYDGNEEYTVEITNETTNESFSKEVKFNGAQGSGAPPRNSAEWIMEMDGNKLSDFGVDDFGELYTGVSGGIDTATASTGSGVINDFGTAVQESISTQNGKKSGTVTSAPSVLASDGSSFKVKWESE